MAEKDAKPETQKPLAVIEEHVVATTRKIVRDLIPSIQKGLLVSEDGAGFAINVLVRPNPDTGEYVISIKSKATIPSCGASYKATINSGQLTLIE